MTLTALIDRLKNRKAQIAASLVEGHAADFSSYSRLVGVAQGLDEALNIINILLEEDETDVE